VAEMTRQKGLASKIQADALEMVHRAEYALGKAACKDRRKALWAVGRPTSFRASVLEHHWGSFQNTVRSGGAVLGGCALSYGEPHG